MLLNNKVKNWQLAQGIGPDENGNKNQGNLPEVSKPKKARQRCGFRIQAKYNLESHTITSQPPNKKVCLTASRTLQQPD
jgi:hypothetical protein